MTSRVFVAKVRHLIDHNVIRLPSTRQTLFRSGGRGIRTGVAAMIDQAIVSGVNFGTALILARFLGAVSYGYYVLLFAILLFIAGIQSALITSPLMVFAPHHQGAAYRRYLNSLSLIQLGICIGIGLVLTLLMPVLTYWFPSIMSEVSVAALVLTVTTYLLQDYLRRVLFVERDSVGGLGVDLISYGLQIVVLTILIVQHRLSLGSVIWAIGLTSLVSCLFGFVRLKPVFDRRVIVDAIATWRQHWNQGRWLLAGTMAQWTSSQVYVFVLAGILTPYATGMFAASRNLIGFGHIFMLGLENFVPATVTKKLVHGGVDEMNSWLRKFRLLLLLMMGPYYVLIIVFAQPLMHLIYGDQYKNTEFTVMLLSCVGILVLLQRPSIIALRATHKSKWIFYAHLLSSIINVLSAVPLITYFGIVGSALGLVLTQLCINVFAGLAYRRVVRELRANVVKHADEQHGNEPERMR